MHYKFTSAWLRMPDVWISEVINQLLIGILEEGGQGQSVVSDPNELRSICHDDLSIDRACQLSFRTIASSKLLSVLHTDFGV